jgi:hypothetical protein
MQNIASGKIEYKLIFSIFIILFLNTANNCNAVEWFNGEISAVFTGEVYWVRTSEDFILKPCDKGEGLGAFSFSRSKAVEYNGDISLEIIFQGSNAIAKLSGSTLYDLGALASTPVSIIIPKENSDEKPIKIGHYYLVISYNRYTLLRILDFQIKERKNISSDLFYIKDSAICSLIFEHSPPKDSLDNLNAYLSNKNQGSQK